ncbi:MAG: ParB/RepB/Spo0J family partition protein [Gammaproteobacteria bacterium]|nr:ParB/RepB/Spo0J family partition protein [Gammaproteobacteria bacterium]NNM21355.1 ParB/RepB/Spo0J family partition protein [Gammaproteobacteria bacterium]
MAAKRKGLGRGLDVLLSTPAKTDSSADGELLSVAIDLLEPGKYQPRVDMRPETLNELADSISSQGVVQPIVIRPLGSGTNRYEIVAGERRWRAAQIAGLDEIPAVVRDVSDSAAVAMALIENIQREDLNPLEEARALERLIEEFDMTHQRAADAVGRSRAAVTNLLRLLDLGEEVAAMVERRELEMGHARALLGLSGKAQAAAARDVARRGLSVRETERLVKRLQGKKGTNGKARKGGTDPDIKRLEGDLSERLGARVSVHHEKSGRGVLEIRYNSLDELEGILQRIR